MTWNEAQHIALMVANLRLTRYLADCGSKKYSNIVYAFRDSQSASPMAYEPLPLDLQLRIDRVVREYADELEQKIREA